MQSIEQILSILLEEFKQNLPNTEGSVTRSISFVPFIIPEFRAGLGFQF